MKRYLLFLEEDMRNKIKAASAIRGMTMLDWMRESFTEKLKREFIKEVK